MRGRDGTRSISYLLAGDAEIDFASALDRLGRYFGIKKIMLEGGGGMNGALLAARLIDELSLLVCPIADGSPDLPTVFDFPPKKVGKKATALTLISTKIRPAGVVWLRYRFK